MYVANATKLHYNYFRKYEVVKVPVIPEIYKNFDEKSRRILYNVLSAKTIEYRANQMISYSMGKRNVIGIVETGRARMIRYEYTGERTILDEINEGDIFSDMFVESDFSELSVESITDCTVTFINYEEIIEKSESSRLALQFLNNFVHVINHILTKRNERIELLTTRSIRNKLLAYFELQAKKNNSKTFNLNYSYTDLADYLAVDRSALMRELKNLKEEKFIKDVNKKITLLY